jgi:hypothetical protein
MGGICISSSQNMKKFLICEFLEICGLAIQVGHQPRSDAAPRPRRMETSKSYFNGSSVESHSLARQAIWRPIYDCLQVLFIIRKIFEKGDSGERLK